jgi:hypothetical protein
LQSIRHAAQLFVETLKFDVVPPFKWLDRFCQLHKALEERVTSLASDDANPNAESNFYKRLWKIVSMLLRAKMPKDKGRLLRLMSSFIGAYFLKKIINFKIIYFG